MIPSSDTQNEVIKLYAQILNRAPDAEGLAYWTYQMSFRLDSAGVANQLSNSAEGMAFLADKDADLSDLYAVFSGSPGDTDSLNYWAPIYGKYYGPFINGQILELTPALSEETITIYDFVQNGFQYASFINTRGPGLRVPVHIHTGDSKTTVLQGEVTVFMDSHDPQVYKVGETYDMPAFVRMSALSTGEVPMVVQDKFVVPVGSPIWIVDENMPGQKGAWGFDQSANRSLEQIADIFRFSPGGLENYPISMSNEELVSKAYINLERQPITQELLDFYVKELNDGASFAHVVTEMIDPSPRMPPLNDSGHTSIDDHCLCCSGSVSHKGAVGLPQSGDPMGTLAYAWPFG